MTHGPEKSDPSTVAMKPANKSEGSDAESVERREGAEGNTSKERMRRTPSRISMSSGLERVRERAKAEKKERFTALLHHVDVDLLRSAFSWLKRDAAPGVDGMTWRQYEQKLEGNLVDLHARVHRGAYRAQPSRRKFIPTSQSDSWVLIAQCSRYSTRRSRLRILSAARSPKGVLPEPAPRHVVQSLVAQPPSSLHMPKTRCHESGVL